MLGQSASTTNEPLSFVLSRWLFLKLLGLVYLIAFGSLVPQLTGLVGTNGLLPIEQYLERSYALLGTEAYYQLPTLLWLWPSDIGLLSACVLGLATAIVAIVGFAPILSFATLWLLYLSLVIAGQDFLSFQWDALLLEAGLLAVFYSPLAWRPSLPAQKQPSAAARWMIWGLAFKLTFLSGVTKLLSGDETWRTLSALQYHYETQPLPTVVSWYVHNAPDWFGLASIVLMFVIEIMVPFVIFLPTNFRRIRTAGCALLCLLQLFIALTGNYGFFNVLTIVLYLSLLDDHIVAVVLPRHISTPGPSHEKPQLPQKVWSVAIAGVTITLAVLSALSLVREIRRPQPMPAWSTSMLSLVAPLRSINGYGLFRTMTTERPEIVIEGSSNGVTWHEYEFKWKVGNVTTAPSFVQPHMPRLDWQMWFAALSPRQQSHWLIPLAERLRDNDPGALSLINANPFSDDRALFVRLSMYRYTFTTMEESKNGTWWKREFLGHLTDPIAGFP